MPSKPYSADAAAIFKTALDTARHSRKSEDYRVAAQWADKAATEAPYLGKEAYWVQAEELNAMADALKLNAMAGSLRKPEALQPLRIRVTEELQRLQRLPAPSTSQLNTIRDLEIVLGLVSAKPQTTAAALRRVKKHLWVDTPASGAAKT